MTTQAQLDTALDRQHTIPVQISNRAPLPVGNNSYYPIRQLQNSGLAITLRELLHAIGSKTAALPASATDDCLRASLLYTYILDLDRPTICFKPGIDSDLQTPRSQEMGIGMMCLLAQRAFSVPWDQLGSLPGRGLRFDYRGRRNGFDGIFESKGTSHRGNQNGQIDHGIEKKQAHHARGDTFDVELIISTFVGRGNQVPRILVGDPDFDRLAAIHRETENRFFRLRHYSRVLQFVGLPNSAFALNRYAKAYLKGERRINQTILSEKQSAGYLTTETFGNNRYYGRWYDTVVTEGSSRYSEERYGETFLRQYKNSNLRRVFQGMREDVYWAGFEGEPFTHELLSTQEIEDETRRMSEKASLFPDGTIQIFKQN